MVRNEPTKPAWPSPLLGRRAAQALPGDHRARSRQGRGDREERGPARHQRGRRGDRQARGELHRQHQGLHAQGAGENRYTGQDEDPDELSSCGRSKRRSTSWSNRKEDFRREIMNFTGALAADVPVHGRPTTGCEGRSSLRSRTEGPTCSKTLVAAVVDKETQEKIDIIGREAHQELRVQRSERDGRAQLRGIDLRARPTKAAARHCPAHSTVCPHPASP